MDSVFVEVGYSGFRKFFRNLKTSFHFKKVFAVGVLVR